MKVAVTGAAGVIGTSVIPTLIQAGHQVVGLTRTPDQAARVEALGATAVHGSLLDHDGLVAMFTGADAVANFASQVPVGLATLWPGSWRTDDWLRTEGVRRVVGAARAAGIRRLVQESVSFLYADQGDEVITEASPLEITRATEPATVGETHVQDYSCRSRSGVVLRFGVVVGDEPATRSQLGAIRHGRPVGLGRPDGWIHVVHTGDLGPAVLAALAAPGGVYNVGAEPVRRLDLVTGFALAAGRDSAEFMSPLRVRLAGVRLEPLTRSLRVSSEHLTASTGWTPRRPKFDSSWLDTVESAGSGVSDDGGAARRAAVEQAARRRRRAQVFGEGVPLRSRDERGDAWGDGEPSSEEWLRRQVPPHHGG